VIPKIGLLINPIAGLGGTVGLKGTDGLSEEALARGAIPRSRIRTEETLSLLSKDQIEFLTASGQMGEEALLKSGITRYTILYTCGEKTTADDTIAACRAFKKAGADLIVFAGGDGTARDVLRAVGPTIPVLGIPAGVKMFSAIFASDPIRAATLIREVHSLPTRDAEVLDIDEEAYRHGSLTACLYGIAKTPFKTGYVQHAKEPSSAAGNEEEERRQIAEFMALILASERPFILGPGSTTEAIAREMGLPKTLLGFDAYAGGSVDTMDLNEKTLLSFLATHHEPRLIISPIGSQGFILGRGTQVITPDAIKKIGFESIIVVATNSKLRTTPDLHIDTGDHQLDCLFPDTVRVICGYGIAERRKLLRSGCED